MSVIVRDVSLPVTVDVWRDQEALREAAARALGAPIETIGLVRVRKVSVDARGKNPRRVVTAEVWRADEVAPAEPTPVLRRPPRMRSRAQAPIIVGSGPAGLWAALRCVEAGQPVVLLERGGALATRHGAVRGLRREGVLDPESNLCFGAGGAGTYSDGKLYTRRRDEEIRRVHEDLVAAGAPRDIMIDAHPHVGTNQLIRILDRLDHFLGDAGCDVRYGAKVVALLRTAKGEVAGVRLGDGTEIEGSAVVLATGHSARDVYGWLAELGVQMARKPFAIGARCEHPQPHIDALQYGVHAGQPGLEPAEYFLTAQIGARGVYSFCMCPGGFVIPTSTELGRLNVNGMSNHRRGSDFGNAAIVVTLEPNDFWIERPGDLDAYGPLAGVALQRHVEGLAFAAGGGGFRAPAQRLSDFLEKRAGDLPGRTSYRPGLTPADLRTVLPARVTDAMARGVARFEQRMPGYVTREAILIGAETTTSSPVRIVRDEATLEAPGFPGFFPAGEGAGMAGGIVSSALDGLRVAEAVLRRIGQGDAV